MRAVIVLDAGRSHHQSQAVSCSSKTTSSRFPIPDSRLPISYFLRTLNQINKLSSITL
ncbi:MULTISPECIES: hypothetical protein [unclassified Moorena]|uniref:hypothetical protein n=1 Tax=unclassified Moorena TaxID=2683338 RepID=UPI0014002CAA|nr:MULTISPECIES: hypothetical protein [unclassified Moorena]NEO16651.1 hypothetical protein [Moorena sp. SIO3E8]NEQ03226.1 hypothetical protein [Moorena sp. SIO3F7]